MVEPNLFTDWPEPASVADSPTSIAAAKEIEPVAGKLRRQVYEFIRERGQTGATDEEIQDALGMDGSTERPRRRELEQAGYIRESGQKRLTRSRRNAAVWIVVEGRK